MRCASQILPFVTIALLMPAVTTNGQTATSGAAASGASTAERVLLVSFDGMRADYLIDADRHQLRIPVLRRLMHDGVTARRMISVFPSVTYPAHVSLITGEPAARHGIPDNERFQPLVDRSADWYWSARDIQVPTLLDAFRCAKRRSASIGWPVSVGAPADWNFPELWDSSDFNSTFVARSREAATPGFIENAEKEFGFVLGLEHIEEQKTLIARFLVRQHRPDLLMLHFNELDKKQHLLGPGVPEVFASLEKLDALLGKLLEEYAQAGLSAGLITCVVSDHGFERVDRMFKPNAVLRQAGLINYDAGSKCITGWRAKAWTSGASASLILADSSDEESLRAARAALAAYTGNTDSAIGRFVEKTEITRLGANPRAALMFDSGEGWMYSRSAAGEAIEPAPIHGMHGQMPDRPQLAASFVIAGPGIAHGRILDRVSMLDVAPTLANLLRVPFGRTTGRPMAELTLPR